MEMGEIVTKNKSQDTREGSRARQEKRMNTEGKKKTEKKKTADVW